jgi:myosin light chain 6
MSASADDIRKICEIYDWDMKGELDMYYFMDIFYALGINIVKKVCIKYGQTDDTGKKFCKFDEVIGLVQKALKEPEIVGNYHDFVELCKLYDKNENGTMMLAELENILSNMGDLIPKEDTTKMLDELAGKEDEDGFFPYTPFLDKLCGKA